MVVFRKSPPPPEHRIRFSFAGSIDSPRSEAFIPLDTLHRSRKWTQFPATTTVSDTGEVTLGDIFTIKRGLATGSNSFFIMSETDAKSREIPRRFLKPILPGPRHMTADIIEALADGAPAVSPRLYLLDCSEPEESINTKWPRFHEYLKHGRRRRYMTRISPATVLRGIRRSSAPRHRSSAPTWAAPATASTRSVSSGTVHKQPRITST